MIVFVGLGDDVDGDVEGEELEDEEAGRVVCKDVEDGVSASCPSQEVATVSFPKS